MRCNIGFKINIMLNQKMMRTGLLLLIMSGSLLNTISFAQGACKVMVSNLQGDYQGDCKNRLAHGKGLAKGVDFYEGEFSKGFPDGNGKYVWANGQYYIGQFKEGLRHGKGTMYVLDSATQTLHSGKLAVWKNDQYIEVVLEKKYKLIRSLNTTSVLFNKLDEDKNRVTILLKNAQNLGGFDVINSSGFFKKMSNNRYLIEECTFPLNIQVNYSSQSGIGQAVQVQVAFELESAGNWEVSISNQ